MYAVGSGSCANLVPNKNSLLQEQYPWTTMSPPCSCPTPSSPASGLATRAVEGQDDQARPSPPMFTLRKNMKIKPKAPPVPADGYLYFFLYDFTILIFRDRWVITNHLYIITVQLIWPVMSGFNPIASLVQGVSLPSVCGISCHISSLSKSDESYYRNILFCPYATFTISRTYYTDLYHWHTVAISTGKFF